MQLPMARGVHGVHHGVHPSHDLASYGSTPFTALLSVHSFQCSLALIALTLATSSLVLSPLAIRQQPL